MSESLNCPVCKKALQAVFMVDGKTYANVLYYRCKEETHTVEVTVKA